MSAAKPSVRTGLWSAHPGLRSACRVFGLTVGVWLVIFHAALLARRLADQSLLEPIVGFKWLVSAALLAALPLARRAGLRLGDPRRVAALAVLVLLLHVALPTPLPLAGGSQDTGGATSLGWALLAITPAAIGVAAIGALPLLSRRSRSRSISSLPWWRLPSEPGRRCPDRAVIQLFGRPPPALIAI